MRRNHLGIRKGLLSGIRAEKRVWMASPISSSKPTLLQAGFQIIDQPRRRGEEVTGNQQRPCIADSGPGPSRRKICSWSFHRACRCVLAGTASPRAACRLVYFGDKIFNAYLFLGTDCLASACTLRPPSSPGCHIQAKPFRQAALLNAACWISVQSGRRYLPVQFFQCDDPLLRGRFQVLVWPAWPAGRAARIPSPPWIHIHQHRALVEQCVAGRRSRRCRWSYAHPTSMSLRGR